MSLEEPKSHTVHWRLKLEEFQYKITYKKCHKHTDGDAFSTIKSNFNESQPKIPLFKFNEIPGTAMHQSSTSRETGNQSIIRS